MLLAIDVGNTNVVFALFDASLPGDAARQPQGRWRIATDPRRTADEYAVWLTQLLAIQGVDRKAIDRIIISTVVPRALHNLKVLSQNYFGVEAWVAGVEPVDYAIDVDVDEPRSLGADRAVNAVAAHAKHAGDLILVDFGTATTFDVIDFNGAIYATCDEQERGRHAGWLDFGGAGFWTSGAWSPPAWWRAAWPDAATPVDLLPTDAASPNTDSIGIELLIHHQHYTHDQYVALARLIADLATRYPALRPTAAPEAQRLLGHEDVDPRTGEGGRANAGGGWDPGAHRDAPFFDWDRLWAELAPRLPS